MQNSPFYFRLFLIILKKVERFVAILFTSDNLHLLFTAKIIYYWQKAAGRYYIGEVIYAKTAWSLGDADPAILARSGCI
ncbi:hypothetical protein DFO70_107158 [Cytobacillus firmus]|uniref:Uncharacterized protein n=2 Tax=Cytobacillus TaxID=2675230 RepID=A0A366JTC4_CYTFI|nr:hypothetical protein DFO70_107158 [Cytobacillus firmus]TDX42088.1 hypothetical protein DFO72_107252 [Cytobacillus oceanisediminis]